MASSKSTEVPKTSCMASSFPVTLPEDSYLTASAEDFRTHICDELMVIQLKESVDLTRHEAAISDIEAWREKIPENMTLTANGALAHATTGSPLVDLFTELEKSVRADRLPYLLSAAWKENSLFALKIMFNARSIHLGKGEQDTFYQCMGWLKNHHPETFIVNLQWLYRSVIEVKVNKDSDKKPEEEELELIEATDEASGTEVPDLVNGASHGYWKDLLNLLVLAVRDELKADGKTRHILHAPNKRGPQGKRRKLSDSAYSPSSKIGSAQDSIASIRELSLRHFKYQGKELRHQKENERYELVLTKLKDPVYRILHLSVARQFAAQLNKDKTWLNSGDRSDLRKISLAAKWAPSNEGFHDKHTCVASSLAEILYPRSTYGAEYNFESREEYLRRARADYQRLTLAPLRKALDIVERDISSGNFAGINYSGVPSVAMDTYKGLFIQKDFGRFERYIEKVAQGKAKINAAVLNPAVLVSQARLSRVRKPPVKDAKKLLEKKIEALQTQTLDGQWNSLVQRIRDNGTLSSAIAVCDVSGSMQSPSFSDKTTPLDTAIGLSLLLAQIGASPFGGKFITFSDNPSTVEVGGPKDTRSFHDKIRVIERSNWSMSTNFVAVFEELLLPIAVRNHTPPEDMVKTVFVFSDMQFNQSNRSSHGNWETAQERLVRKYKEAGYELPRLVYWNINGGSYSSSRKGMPKPVVENTENALMVSGYSSSMLKMFLDQGVFEGSIDEEEDMLEVKNDKTEELKVQKVKKTVDPMDAVLRAIGHKAYDGLTVVD